MRTTRRSKRLRRWGTETAERLGLKTDTNLQRLIEQTRTGARKPRR